MIVLFPKSRGVSVKKTSSKPSALSYESGIDQSSPVAKPSNFFIDHILQTGETAAKRSEAMPTEDSSSTDECINADLQSMEQDSSSLDSSDESNGVDGLQQDDVNLMLKKRELNISAFQDVITSIPEMNLLSYRVQSQKALTEDDRKHLAETRGEASNIPGSLQDQLQVKTHLASR